jgi:hypothetical protein
MSYLRVPILFGWMVTLSCLFTSLNALAQIVLPPQETDCNGSGYVTVTIADSSGAVIPNAFVLFRGDRLGTREKKPFVLQTQTNSVGEIKTSLPCGYVDFFAAADGFIPHAEKLLVRNVVVTSVRLDVDKSMKNY